MNPLVVKILVYGPLLGCVFSLNAWVFVGKSHWQINIFIGLVVMSLAAALDRLIPGIGLFVTFGLGMLAGYTVILRERKDK